MKLWTPSPMHCHIRNRLSYYRWSPSVSFQFSGKILLKIFPLLTSLSQPLLIFTSLFITNELALWHHNSWSKHWTRPEKDTAWLKNNAWSKHWTRPESSPASLPSSVIVSIPLSPSPKCNMYLPGAIYISLSLSIFHVHGLVWVFCWMWKRVFDLKYWCWLWLVRQHSSIIFLNIKFYWMHWYIKVLMLVWVFMNFLSSTFILNPKC